MRILAIEPYYGLSHRSFLEGWRKYSRHDVEVWSLSPRKWKWRMRGSAYHFAERARGLPAGVSFDAILVSDFLNLPDFLALAPARLRALPTLAYFHENQITYPLGQHAPVDFHYGWINLSTALAADRVLFNSQHHRAEFLQGVADVVRRMPDHVPDAALARLAGRSGVLPVGIDFDILDAARARAPRRPNAVPVVLWNHRWEYDKGPELFFDVLRALDARRVPFRLVVCGQAFKSRPPVFDEARRTLADRIDHFGYFPSAADYHAAVSSCDVVVSTAVHEFFGVAIVEAIGLGCLPALPRRLSYPEIVPLHLHPFFLYERDADLAPFLEDMLLAPRAEYRDELRESLDRLHWRRLAPELDAELESLSR